MQVRKIEVSENFVREIARIAEEIGFAEGYGFSEFVDAAIERAHEDLDIFVENVYEVYRMIIHELFSLPEVRKAYEKGYYEGLRAPK